MNNPEEREEKVKERSEGQEDGHAADFGGGGQELAEDGADDEGGVGKAAGMEGNIRIFGLFLSFTFSIELIH